MTLGIPGIPAGVKFNDNTLSNPLQGVDEDDWDAEAKNIYKTSIGKTIPSTREDKTIGLPFTPTPRGDLQPNKYYAVDPIYLKNVERYKTLGKRINAFEIEQRRAFIKRQIADDLSKSSDWADVAKKARAYRFSLFKEDTRRRMKEYDQSIKNIQMRKALAVHNLKFDVDPPLITMKDIDGIVGGLGRGVTATTSITDQGYNPLGLGAEGEVKYDTKITASGAPPANPAEE